MNGTRFFWMRSLTGQLIGLLLLALVLSQAIFFLLYRSERETLVRNLQRDEFLARVASVTRLLTTTETTLHPEILRAASTTLSRYWLTAEAPVEPVTWQRGAREYLLQALPAGPLPIRAERGAGAVAEIGRGTEGEMGRKGDGETRRLGEREMGKKGEREGFVTNPRFTDADLRVSTTPTWETLAGESWPGGRAARLLTLDGWNGLGLAVQIREGFWLQTVYAKPDLISQSRWHYSVSFGVTALLLLLLAVMAARRVGRPLQRLTEAAERLGRGEEVELLPEGGAEDVRRTTEAFNRMQSRLRRFVEDRTRMMAAISHDLRTPITSLRLRAEFIEETEMREKIIATLDEMQAMTEAALTFAREEATAEQTRMTDLDALIESLCDDLAEMGWDVTCAELKGEGGGDGGGSGRVPWRGRPDGLKRALRNLIENAVRYGERARVRLVVAAEASAGAGGGGATSASGGATTGGGGEWLEIVVEDDGPGIPAAEMERVFAPFVRLEGSRNRATGGVGLGLAIARTIVRSHGGDVVLANRVGAEGNVVGLRAVVRLPRG